MLVCVCDICGLVHKCVYRIMNNNKGLWGGQIEVLEDFLNCSAP